MGDGLWLRLRVLCVGCLASVVKVWAMNATVSAAKLKLCLSLSSSLSWETVS